jgi:hypothetical protein
MTSRPSKLVTTSRDRNVFGLACLLAASVSPIAAQTKSVDAHEIMKQSLAAGSINAQRSRDYVSQNRVLEKEIEADGAVRSEVVKGYQTLVVDGVLVKKLVMKNDRPLPADEARKEDERIRKLVREYKEESTAAKRKRIEEQDKKREKEREFGKEILDAFIFKVIGEEAVSGRKSWVIEANPRPGFAPREMRAKIFPHIKGRIWIDQSDKLWTKVDAIGIDAFSVGFGIVAKLEQGAHLYFEQDRLEDGTWVLRQAGLRANTRVAMVKRIAVDRLSTYRDYQKVPAGFDLDASAGK